MPGKKAIIFKALYVTGRHGRRCGGHKREGSCALPGEIHCSATKCYCHRKVAGWGSGSQPKA